MAGCDKVASAIIYLGLLAKGKGLQFFSIGHSTSMSSGCTILTMSWRIWLYLGVKEKVIR